ncbi:MAG TPA: DUF4127 family protein [Bacilli bacterium]|mgnify:FL=1|jgi:hypothetical protein|nr:MAG: hypothetical protein BWX94_01218 [Tenericutes bacterium ADurb.Bin140]HON64062.1 DUF4127 family protein [Bacilli bacterium]HOR96530.1 DUF4127 family protein [Bacilli bacterium]HPD12460.1 DUF4127 family protein [Bacilli bacterium]HRU49213.1 DUF4127 family protein [Bacilli bacterium]
MKQKVVLLPLDERPCNYVFPQRIFKETDIEVVTCDLSILGQKKTPAKIDKLQAFLLKETRDAYGLVVSIDMLLYGGIVPSRLHHETEETLRKRLEVLRQIKKNNPKIKIFAFDLIMRCPQYSSSDEEPDYYAICGREIFLSGYLQNRVELGLATEEEHFRLNDIWEKIKPEYLQDFLHRRELNLKLNLASLDLVKENVIDFLIFPQDDASEFGYTAKDQTVIRKQITDGRLAFQVYMYPDADGVTNVLLSRMLLQVKGIRPLVYIRYLSPASPMQVPCLEDRYLDVSVRYQILASGALVATSASEADIVLLVASGGDKMETGPDKQHNPSRSITVLRNLVDGLEYAEYCIKTLKKPVMIADIAYLNGADLELVALLNKRGLLFELASYAGWNTAANSLGTCIPHGITTMLYGKTKSYYDFMVLRYLEDAMYCSIVRSLVTNQYLAERGYNYFYVAETDGVISQIVKEEIIKHAQIYLSELTGKYRINRCYMPWARMFEVGLDVEYLEKGN